jgi:plastocyanin
MVHIRNALVLAVTLLVLVAAGAALAVVTTGARASDQQKVQGKLVGTVGPGFTISLTKGGKAVKVLKPGTYRITVRDRSSVHDFHLVGPGVNKKTGVSFKGTVVWKNVKLKKGTYRFVCDPHASQMKGSFKVSGAGTGTTGTGTTGTTTTGAGTTSTEPASNELFGTVGPGFTISLTRESGAALGTLAPGAYEIKIDDKSASHNFHLTGPGVSQTTTVSFVGSVVWEVTLAKGSYTYVCDPHASTMNGQFEVG